MSNNYFVLFGLEEVYHIDIGSLRSSYQEKITANHPDQFTQSNDVKAVLTAEQNTAVLNTAYETLLNPLTRASYLLELKGINVFDEHARIDDKNFIMTQVELHEELNKLGSVGDVEKLNNFVMRIESKINGLEASISQSFKVNNFERAKSDVIALKFYGQLLNQGNDFLDNIL